MTSVGFKLAFALALASGVLACSSPLLATTDGASSSSSCDHRAAPGSYKEARCTDYKSAALGQSSFKSSCDVNKGSVIASCPHAGSLGGCSSTNVDQHGSDSTDWYYDGPAVDGGVETADTVRARCGSATFVTP